MYPKLNRNFKWLLLLLTVVITGAASAQTTDLARIEYTYFPQSDSDNSFRRFKSFINFPIKLNDNGAYLVPGIEYRNTNLKYNDPAVFDTNDLDRFQSFTGSLGYTFKMNELWRFGIIAGLKIASNFETSEIVKDDMIYDGSVYFIKIKEDERYI